MVCVLLKIFVVFFLTISVGWIGLNNGENITLFYRKGVPVTLEHIWNNPTGALVVCTVLIMLAVAVFKNWTDGIKSKIAGKIYWTIFILCSAAMVGFYIMYIKPHKIWMTGYLLQALNLFISTLVTYKKNKKEFEPRIAAIAAIVLIVLISVWITPTHSNGRNKFNSQIVILCDTLDVRAECSADSKRLTVVNKGDIFDFHGTGEPDEGTWYKIHTNLGVVGYVAAGTSHENIKNLYNTPRGVKSNERNENVEQIRILKENMIVFSAPALDGTRIDRLYRGEIYTVEEKNVEENRIWYRITTGWGLTGYLYEDTVGSEDDVEILLQKESSLSDK